MGSTDPWGYSHHRLLESVDRDLDIENYLNVDVLNIIQLQYRG